MGIAELYSNHLNSAVAKSAVYQANNLRVVDSLSIIVLFFAHFAIRVKKKEKQ